MKRLNSTPKSDGFRMPGEFEKHSGCYMIWPERPDNWRLGGKPAQKVFAEVANTIAKYEPMTMIVSKNQYSNARSWLDENVRLVEMSNDDSWVRDCGATFVIDDKGGVRGVDWKFNAWGGLVDGLYFPWDSDDKIASKMCELERVDSYRTEDFVLEGGSVHAYWAEAQQIAVQGFGSRIDSFHYLAPPFSISCTFRMISSRSIRLPPLRRQVSTGQRSFSASFTSYTICAGLLISMSSTPLQRS